MLTLAMWVWENILFIIVFYMIPFNIIFEFLINYVDKPNYIVFYDYVDIVAIHYLS